VEIRQIINQIVNNTENLIEHVKKNNNPYLNLTIEAFPEDLISSPFVTRERWEVNKTVDVFEIVGIAHPDYIGLSWIDMLKEGKRMSTVNLPLLEKNPEYYLENDPKNPAIEYTKINDEIYISGDGYHRTSIAKVLLYFLGQIQFSGVKCREIEVDLRLAMLVDQAKALIAEKKLPLVIEVKKQHVKRKDGPGWSEDFFMPEIEVVNVKKLKRIYLHSFNEVGQLISEVNRFNLFTKFFRCGRFLRKIL